MTALLSRVKRNRDYGVHNVRPQRTIGLYYTVRIILTISVV